MFTGKYKETLIYDLKKHQFSWKMMPFPMHRDNGEWILKQHYAKYSGNRLIKKTMKDRH